MTGNKRFFFSAIPSADSVQSSNIHRGHRSTLIPSNKKWLIKNPNDSCGHNHSLSDFDGKNQKWQSQQQQQSIYWKFDGSEPIIYVHVRQNALTNVIIDTKSLFTVWTISFLTRQTHWRAQYVSTHVDWHLIMFQWLILNVIIVHPENVSLFLTPPMCQHYSFINRNIPSRVGNNGDKSSQIEIWTYAMEFEWNESPIKIKTSVTRQPVFDAISQIFINYKCRYMFDARGEWMCVTRSFEKANMGAAKLVLYYTYHI